MRIQKQTTVSEYRGFQFRHSAITGHVTIYEPSGVGRWDNINVKKTMAAAKLYIDGLIQRREEGKA